MLIITSIKIKNIKKIIFSALTVSVFALGSCGGSKEEAAEKKGPELCTCVKRNWENDEEKKACEEMKNEWMKKYETASTDEQKEMMEAIEACN